MLTGMLEVIQVVRRIKYPASALPVGLGKACSKSNYLPFPTIFDDHNYPSPYKGGVIR